MAIRVTFDIDLALSESRSGSKELGIAPWAGTNDQLDDGGAWRRRISAGATNVAIDINGLANGRLVAVKTSQPITLKRNSVDDTGWVIRPLGTGATDGIFICTTDGVTTLYVTNAGSEAAEVTFMVAGIF